MNAPTFAIDPAEFAGKRVLVAGGSRGMGAATVARLRQGGARVLTTARSLPHGERQDGDFIVADLSTAPSCATVVRRVLIAFLASPRAASITGSEFVIDGGTIPTV